MIRAIVILAALSLTCCRPAEGPMPVEPDAEAPSVEACAPACAALRDHACRVGLPNARGESCEDLCGRDQAQGLAAQLRPACVSAAKTIDDVRACGVRCSEGR